MVVEPADAPDTAPPVETVAADELLLLHTPPVMGSFNVAPDPVHISVLPVIVPAAALTIMAVLLTQPVGNVYFIVCVLATSPATTPELIPTLAAAWLVLLQVPPPILFANVTD